MQFLQDVYEISFVTQLGIQIPVLNFNFLNMEKSYHVNHAGL